MRTLTGDEREALARLLESLSADTLQLLGNLDDAAFGVAEWTIGVLPLGTRALLHAYGAILIGASASDDTPALRAVEILPLGRALIATASDMTR